MQILKRVLSFNATVSPNGKKRTIILKFNERALPIRYLGVPIVLGRLSAQACNLLLHNITFRINSRVFCWENYLIKCSHLTSFSQYVWTPYGLRGGLMSYPLLLLGGFNWLPRNYITSGLIGRLFFIFLKKIIAINWYF